METRTFYNAFVHFEDGTQMFLTTGNFKRNFKTYEEAMQAIEKAKYNYSKKDMKRTYADGSYVWLSYNDQHDLKYSIEKHYDEYEVLYEEESPKGKKELKEGTDSIELTL